MRAVATVADALAEVARAAPHVIISDFDLSPGSGAELLSAVAHTHPAVRRILFSGSSNSTIEELLRRDIAHAFVPKGSPTETLLETVAQVLERSAAELLATAALAGDQVVQILGSLTEVVGEAQAFLRSSAQPFDDGELLDWARLRLSATSHLGLAVEVLQHVISELCRVQLAQCAACDGSGCDQCNQRGEQLRLLPK